MLRGSYCSTCDKLFHNASLKNGHDTAVHGGLAQPELLTDQEITRMFAGQPILQNRTCNDCGKIFSSRTSCVSHAKRCRKPEVKTPADNTLPETSQIPLPPPPPPPKTDKRKCTTCLLYIYE